jgi:hypothetical protein
MLEENISQKYIFLSKCIDYYVPYISGNKLYIAISLC